MKGSVEVRFLLVSVVLLMALVVPVAAATFGGGTGAGPDASADLTPPARDLPATANTSLVIEVAPPPLIFMALGGLLVVAMIGRRARRLAAEPLRGSGGSGA